MNKIMTDGSDNQGYQLGGSNTYPQARTDGGLSWSQFCDKKKKKKEDLGRSLRGINNKI